jgi:hypothetical protein
MSRLKKAMADYPNVTISFHSPPDMGGGSLGLHAAFKAGWTEVHNLPKTHLGIVTLLIALAIEYDEVWYRLGGSRPPNKGGGKRRLYVRNERI